MKSSSLEILENARLPSDQARAILQAMEAELEAHNSQLATRSDLNALEARLAHRFNSLLVAVTGIFAVMITVYSGVVGLIVHFAVAK